MGFLRKKCEIWRPLSSALKIPQEKLDVISNHCQSDFDSMIEVCDVWLAVLRERNIAPTWLMLLAALEETGAHELVAELKEMLDIGATMNTGMKTQLHITIMHTSSACSTVKTTPL